jgi:tight adherence protein B
VNQPLAALVVALAGAYGVHLLYTAVVSRWSGFGPGPSSGQPRARARSLRQWMTQAGLGEVRAGEFAGVVVALAALGASVGYALFGAVIPALLIGVAAGAFPLTSYRARRRARLARAREAWPAMIEEIRILTSTAGMSIPQALFEVGRRAPEELQPAFELAHREWLLSTDFARCTNVLKQRLADPTADATCETLLVAHDLGGIDLDRRLAALAEDRLADVEGRKEAQARQAGARFARRFVLIVPFGMALAGMSVGTGRAAYRTAEGQLAVLLALMIIGACWVWAGRIMALPDERRVFAE